ncbi:transcription factor AP-2-epsilon-like, partial [Limulus polyphemus]|uniref:Transcription factor AP-2-epsilon-like n=1 Tax=Limulus polyphemus TaxID=6850 RepID=A0ABM1RYQ5_LIMPO
MAQLSPLARTNSSSHRKGEPLEENNEVKRHPSTGQDIKSEMSFDLVESPEDRRDLVGGQTTSLVTISSTATFNGTPLFTHTPPSANFQPPYFPPPYNLPQQHVDFHHPHVNADTYTPLTSLTGPPQYHQLHPPQRTHNIFGTRREDDLQINIHSGLAGTYDLGRRGDPLYPSVRNSGHHGLSEQELVSLHTAETLQAIEEGQ